jgi:alpha-ketoglutarate-dependent taurine dioxygenase
MISPRQSLFSGTITANGSGHPLMVRSNGVLYDDRGELSMKTWSHILVIPIAGALGAEISGVHLGELGDGALNEVRDAFVEHQVLFFRDQEITRDQHKAFGRHFGTLQIHPYLQPLKDQGHPEFVVLQSDEQHPYLAEAWHSDVTFMDEPPLGSVLKCIVTPEFGGDTMWASMYAAYEALSDSGCFLTWWRFTTPRARSRATSTRPTTSAADKHRK